MECEDRDLLEPDQALQRLLGIVQPLDAEGVDLDDADGRVLAAPIIARRARPAWDLSAMDGYAVRSEDLAMAIGGLRLAGHTYPGAAPTHGLAIGEACRVTTGARLPPGADRVLIDEEIATDGATVRHLGPALGRLHIRAAGSDFVAGAELVAAGSRIGPTELMLAAAAEAATLRVVRRPRVTFIVTGDEIAAPRDCRSADEVPDSASYPVRALARAWGGAPGRTVRCRDDVRTIADGVAAALPDADVVVMIGGASGSERDHARAVATALGAEPLFAGVAIRPGKPVWAAVHAGKVLLGLPGNPVAALVTARLFLAPLLAALGGRPATAASDWTVRPSLAALPAVGDRTQFLLAARQGDGVRVLARQQTSASADLAGFDTLVRRDPGAPALGALSPTPCLAL